MSDIDGPRLALYVALGLIVCFLGARYLRAEPGAPDGEAVAPAVRTATTAPSSSGDGATSSVSVRRAGGGRATVHVAGAVRRPGVYRMPANARVDDAVRRAGGATQAADLASINLAAKLEDGRQVLVPERAAPAGAGAAAGAQTAPAGAAQSAAPINLNTATLEQLDTLDGVGPGIAKRILDYRDQHDGFRNVEELGEVSGIGEKRMATLKPLVSAG